MDLRKQFIVYCMREIVLFSLSLQFGLDLND
jgi:hypothetical protein